MPQTPPIDSQEIRDLGRDVRNLTFVYLVTLASANALVASADHDALALGSELKLPVLNIETPLVLSFWILPLLLLVFHGGLLFLHFLYSRRIFQFEQQLHGKPRPTRNSVGLYIFPHLLVGEQHDRLVRFAMRVIVIFFLFILPILSVLLIQLLFLAYHDEAITWWHRSIVVCDLLLSAWLLGKMFSRGHNSWRWWLGLDSIDSGGWLSRLVNRAALSSFFVYVALHSLFVATIPHSPGTPYGRWEARIVNLFVPADMGPSSIRLCSGVPQGDGPKRATAVEEARPTQCGWICFAVCARERHSRVVLKLSSFWHEKPHGIIPLRRNLWLPNRDFSSLNADFRGRDLRYSELSNTNLQGVRLTSARLIGADLYRTNLRAAQLDFADLSGATLAYADLQDAIANHSHFKESLLSRANLDRGDFRHTRFEDSWLISASANGADFRFIRASGAGFDEASLVGANFSGSSMDGAFFVQSDLRGANLDYAYLRKSKFIGAQLQGANFDLAKLQGASFLRVPVNGVWFSNASLEPGDSAQATAGAPTAFSGLRASQETPCVRLGRRPVECERITRGSRRDLAYRIAEYWADLACADPAILAAMVERTRPIRTFEQFRELQHFRYRYPKGASQEPAPRLSLPRRELAEALLSSSCPRVSSYLEAHSGIKYELEHLEMFVSEDQPFWESTRPPISKPSRMGQDIEP